MKGKSDNCDGVEDHVLVGRIAQGDEDAFNCLYQRHSLNLLAFLRTKARLADAEDLLQDIWMTLRDHPPADERHQIRGWLFQVARTRLIDFYRRQKKQNLPLIDDIPDKSPDTVPFSEDDEKRKNDLADCIHHLAAEFREALTMWMHNSKHEEIAEKQGVPLNTSHTRVNRAKDKVKECLHRKGWNE